MTATMSAAGSAALLAGLPGIGPNRLAELLADDDPEAVWQLVVAGRVDDPHAEAWAAVARAADPAAEAARYAEAEVRVLTRADAAYPAVLAADLAPPGVLFARGELSALETPRVAIVGTRRCTGTGAGFARELGRELATAGVGVVSGLALGIDGAAHRGVLDAAGVSWAAPIGVVGCGLDVPYPARHRPLWDAVGERGVLLSEAPLGARPAPWRFPARNRIIAALADLVVVVESHAAGGSLLTVTEAIGRGIEVLAVPGSVRNPAAAGTNQLLAEGCHPVTAADDILVALGMVPGGRRSAAERRPAPDDDGRRVLEAFDWEPATLEQLVLRTGLALGVLALSVQQLLDAGWIMAQGSWYERVPSVP
ncbi:MAG: DNA-processing protein DprA [Acidimicrobiales bacterium]|nr:DNA-processing protein DprA [Acidimicrobiales bacterium]